MTFPLVDDMHSVYDHEPVNVARYVTGSGADETDGFNAAANEARATRRGLFMPESLTVRVDGIVNLRYIVNLDIQGIVRVGPEGRVDVGNNSFHRIGAHLRIRRVEQMDPSTQDNVVLRTVGMKQAHIWVDFCDRWEWYADKAEVDTTSTSYCTAYPGYIRRLDFTCRDDPAQSGFGWITQILFLGGDVKYISTDSDSYSTNHITFVGTCLERGEVHLDRAYRWRFIEARCEYGTKFHFGENTSRIVVEDGFISNHMTTGPGAIVVEDLGKENVVTTSFEAQYDRRTLFAVDMDSTILDGCADTDVHNIVPGPRSMTRRAPLGLIFDSGLLPIRGQSSRGTYEASTQWHMPRLAVSSDTASVRPEWSFFRADGTQLTSPVGVEVQGAPAWSSERGSFSYGTDVAASVALAHSADVAYTRVKIFAGAEMTPFTRIELIGFFVGQSSDYVADLTRRRSATQLAQSESPCIGAPRMGTVVGIDSGQVAVVDRREVTVNAAPSGSADVTLSDGTGIAVGDVIGIELSNQATHWSRIAGISGTGGRGLTLDSPLPASSLDGAPAVSVRWGRRG